MVDMMEVIKVVIKEVMEVQDKNVGYNTPW